MENPNNKAEQNLVQSFKQFEELKDISLKQNVVWECNREYHFFDLIIEYAGAPYAVVEIKHSDKSIPHQAEEDIRKAMRILSCPLGILTNGEKSYFYSTEQKEPIYDGEFYGLLDAIKAQIEKAKFNIVDNSVVKTILAEKLKINNELSLLDKGGTLGFSEDNEKFLWAHIIGKKTEKRLCRYTSLDSVVKTLTNGTLRMNGLAAMNDTTETSFFKNIVHPERIIKVPNDIFISSFSTKEDDLTMWRLYGDDGKGACLVFELTKESKSDFIISPVRYVDPNVKRKLKAIGELGRQNVRLMYENIYSHFFKPKEYEEESEIRLLYKSEEIKWSVSPDYSIVNPYIEVPLDKQSLKLTKIILGPKCPNNKLNRAQLSKLLVETKVNLDENAKCKLSKIKCYR